jgi:hypothetical protein
VVACHQDYVTEGLGLVIELEWDPIKNQQLGKAFSEEQHPNDDSPPSNIEAALQSEVALILQFVQLRFNLWAPDKHSSCDKPSFIPASAVASRTPSSPSSSPYRKVQTPHHHL